MTLFIITIGCMMLLATIGKATWVIKGEYPERKRKNEVLDIILYTAIVVWALNLVIVK